MAKYYYMIGLAATVLIITDFILFVKWERKHATKFHNKDFEKFKEKYENKSRRSTVKEVEKVPEYIQADIA